jgi:hypothetical protein
MRERPWPGCRPSSPDPSDPIESATAAVPGAPEIVVSGPEATVVADPGWIEVLDRGPGIDPAIRDGVFEPFFTTKHGGAGLSLPSSSRYPICRVEKSRSTIAMAAGPALSSVCRFIERERTVTCLQSRVRKLPIR